MNKYLEGLAKLPRRTLQILGLVVVVLVGCAYLTWLNSEEASAKITVNNQLNAANRTLQATTQSTNVESVRAELTAVQAQLKESSFPEQQPSVELVSLLVKAARESGIELGNLQVTAVEQEKIGGGSYNVMRQRLQFRGSPTNISGFISRIEKGGFKSLIVNNLSMSPRGSTWEGRIDLNVYSQ